VRIANSGVLMRCWPRSPWYQASTRTTGPRSVCESRDRRRHLRRTRQREQVPAVENLEVGDATRASVRTPSSTPAEVATEHEAGIGADQLAPIQGDSLHFYPYVRPSPS
jgi:hypothetical protein